MSFTSPAYLFFLPVICLMYWLIPCRFRQVLLLAASWLFYFSFDLSAGLLLILTTLVTYLCCLGMGENNGKNRLLLILALVFTLGLLIFFKYAGLFVQGILLPAGISFYTFQTLACVLDVYRKKYTPPRSFITYALFVSFFPQLVAGPVERPGDLIPQLTAPRSFSREYLREGLPLLVTGYFRKVVIADRIARLADPLFAMEQPSGPAVLLAAVLFGVQIYCDFAGYTDIARGSACLMGIRLSENFRQPYRASSVREFWHRWHITLSRWFTDYVYIPLGGNRRRRYMNILLVFLLSGLWHGAGLRFAVWGLLHGLAQILEIRFDRQLSRLPRFLRVGMTWLYVNLCWIFFRAPSTRAALAMIVSLPVGWNALPLPLTGLLTAFLLFAVLHLMENRLAAGKELFTLKNASGTFTLYLYLLILALAALASLITGEGGAFIYFQF